ncbi:YggT family protein [Candidatus Shapirobacteria bacterium]|nr:YggT family protein [Candidatus Shapirobacteria bacterium]
MFQPLFYTLANTILGIVEFLLGLRIILKLFGASSAAPFVTWVYETTQPLLVPFIGAFPSPRIEGGFIIEFSSLFALIVFAFIGYLVDRLFISLVLPRKTNRVTK